jgi:hypothetical protein
LFDLKAGFSFSDRRHERKRLLSFVRLRRRLSSAPSRAGALDDHEGLGLVSSEHGGAIERRAGQQDDD